MSHHEKKRGRIAAEAARRLVRGGDIRRSRIGAARRLAREWVPEDELPSSTDVTRELSRQRLVDDDDRSGGLMALIGDRFDKIAALVRPLAAVRLDATYYHVATLLDFTLLSFSYVEQRRPFDEELLTASLLVEAGRVIDRRRAIEAILDAADGLVSPRTVWLIEMRNAATAYSAGTLGHRARHRLVSHADFDDVMLLAEAVRAEDAGEMNHRSLDQAVERLRALSSACGGPQSYDARDS
jgi:hypothetical protein